LNWQLTPGKIGIQVLIFRTQNDMIDTSSYRYLIVVTVLCTGHIFPFDFRLSFPSY